MGWDGMVWDGMVWDDGAKLGRKMKGLEMGGKGVDKTWHVKLSRNVKSEWGGAKVDGAKMGVKVRIGLDVVWYGMGMGGGGERRGDQVEKGSENGGSGNGQKRVQEDLASKAE